MPFLIIDMAVASILMSMGMMMLPPVIISLPFKLIFFVLVDGWRLIAGSLVQSYMHCPRRPDVPLPPRLTPASAAMDSRAQNGRRAWGLFRAFGVGLRSCCRFWPPAAGHAVSAKTGQGDAASCAALAGQTIAADTVIESAEYLPEGGTVGTTKVSRALLPRSSASPPRPPIPISALKSGCRRPPAGTANSRAKDRAASAGAISAGAMLEALKAGYATMSTDNGHITDTTQTNGGSEQTWALGHPEKMLDFAFRAMHVSTVAAKQVVRSFYGHTAVRSYFVGCSQGGHHALMEASRYPADYDGIVAGAPAWHWANQMINATWNSMAALKDASALTDAKHARSSTRRSSRPATSSMAWKTA